MTLHRLAPAAIAVAGAIAVGAGGASAASILPGSSSQGVGAAVHSLTAPVTSLLGAVLSGRGPSSSSQAAPAPKLPSETRGDTPAPAPAPAPADQSPSASDPAAAPAPPPAARPAEQTAPERQTARPATAPARPGTASAGAANLPPLDTCAGCSGATAGGGTRAQATGLRVAGITLSGGSAEDGTSNHGSLLSLPLGSILGLDLAPWSADTGEDGDHSRAASRSALLDLGVIDGHLAAVSLLESGSVAGAGPDGTEGAASSTGLDVRLLDGLDIGVLHSSATSDGDRSAQLLAINGTGVLGTSGRTDSTGDGSGGLNTDVPGVVGLQLLDTFAGGGTVLGVSELLGSGQVASVVSSSASGAAIPVSLPQGPSLPLPTAPTAPTAPVLGVTASNGAPVTGPVAAAAAPAPRIPLTGVSARLGGLLLVLLGTIVVTLALRGRRVGAEA